MTNIPIDPLPQSHAVSASFQQAGTSEGRERSEDRSRRPLTEHLATQAAIIEGAAAPLGSY